MYGPGTMLCRVPGRRLGGVPGVPESLRRGSGTGLFVQGNPKGKDSKMVDDGIRR
ncbi:hypothetical protein Tmar_1162 [Thermaerobacter marianensis DSM 12885]|uniref:Uncharacterized protein n=1 Tax=Thermaerobacter marianensis (strain ATCC 700841 / DSM 12885 / JCM 10246 / 7p75a) TaxID=644966 RepID=E6SKR7_THEM7|nr:hypothetical protein Tmar_1162 [Thermaerobacter marianensis DSM 12885]